MNEYKLYQRFPKWILPGYIIYLCFFIFGAIDIIINQDMILSITDNKYLNAFVFISPFLGILMFSFGLYIVIRVDFFDKHYYIINDEGIFVNEANLFKKKLKWDSELYYLISKNFFGVFLYKKMLPLNSKIINENNIENGYIIIKTKKALKIMIENKGRICIPTKLLKHNMNMNDIVEILNKSLKIK